MATRERVAWIFHEKARRLHSEANNGKAGPPDLGCLPAGASFIRGGGPARDRVVFINSGSECRERGSLPESRGIADLALCLQAVPTAKCKEREAPSEGPSVDEYLPISGRSPQFFCHGSSQENAACAIRLILAARNYGRRYFWFRLLSVPILSSLFSPTSFFKRYVTVLLGMFRPAEISPAPHGSFAETKETISS